MAKAIKIKGGSSVHLEGGHFENFDVGVEADETSHVSSSNLSFKNVREPWRVQGTAKVTGTRIANDPKQRHGRNSMLGWREVHGPPLPVFCPNCKTIFPSLNYKFAGRFFEAWNNEEPCPECGFEHAKLSEGLFDLSKEAVRVLSAPDITFAMLAAIEKVAAGVRTGTTTPEQAAEKLDQVSPPVGNLWRRALRQGAAATMFLAAVFGAYYARESVLIGQRGIELGEQQVEIAKEELRLQKESNTDKLLDEILNRVKSCTFTSKGIKHKEAEPHVYGDNPAGPTKNEPPEETGSIKLKPQRKPKARDLRRKAKAEYRKAFGGARHKS